MRFHRLKTIAVAAGASASPRPRRRPPRPAGRRRTPRRPSRPAPTPPPRTARACSSSPTAGCRSAPGSCGRSRRTRRGHGGGRQLGRRRVRPLRPVGEQLGAARRRLVDGPRERDPGQRRRGDRLADVAAAHRGGLATRAHGGRGPTAIDDDGTAIVARSRLRSARRPRRRRRSHRDAAVGPGADRHDRRHARRRLRQRPRRRVRQRFPRGGHVGRGAGRERRPWDRRGRARDGPGAFSPAVESTVDPTQPLVDLRTFVTGDGSLLLFWTNGAAAGATERALQPGGGGRRLRDAAHADRRPRRLGPARVRGERGGRAAVLFPVASGSATSLRAILRNSSGTWGSARQVGPSVARKIGLLSVGVDGRGRVVALWGDSSSSTAPPDPRRPVELVDQSAQHLQPGQPALGHRRCTNPTLALSSSGDGLGSWVCSTASSGSITAPRLARLTAPS